MSLVYSLGCGVAFIFLFKLFWPFVCVFYIYTFGKVFSKRGLLKKAGEWAIVTGSTDGIGKAYAHELAKEGLNIMLISRNITKLKSVAEELESAYHVKTKTIVCDFTQADIYDKLSDEINNLESVACLVNNVGISYPSFAQFADADFMDLNFIRQMLNCNMNSVASLTRIVLPLLLKRNRPGSAIINIGSFSGMHPLPYLSLYGASKSFVQHFTEALSYEVRGSNVTLQSVCPLLVATSMSKIKRTSFFVPSPGRYAKDALDMLGVESLTMGYIGHALQAAALSLHPRFVALAAELSYQKVLRRKAN